jgi:hypothetical protein
MEMCGHGLQDRFELYLGHWANTTKASKYHTGKSIRRQFHRSQASSHSCDNRDVGGVVEMADAWSNHALGSPHSTLTLISLGCALVLWQPYVLSLLSEISTYT